MDRHPVASSAIKSIGYDPDSKTLDVEFHHSGIFRYHDVPEFLFRGFMLASSKGQFFNGRIKDRYQFEEIGRL